jgi:thioredoxin 1
MVAYITELNSNNYKEFTKEGIVLVDIHAKWCGPCRVISPLVDQISNDYYGKISVGKLDADETVLIAGEEKSNKEIIVELGVRNIPTLVLYKDGNVVDRLVGSVNKEKIQDLINSHLN